MKSTTQEKRLERLAARAQAHRRRGPRKAREPWPGHIRSGAVALMRSGLRAGRISERIGVPEHTLHTWRQGAEGRLRPMKQKKRTAARARWHEVTVVRERGRPRSGETPAGLRVRLEGGRELVGLSLAQLEAWLRRGVL